MHGITQNVQDKTDLGPKKFSLKSTMLCINTYFGKTFNIKSNSSHIIEH